MRSAKTLTIKFALALILASFAVVTSLPRSANGSIELVNNGTFELPSLVGDAPGNQYRVWNSSSSVPASFGWTVGVANASFPNGGIDLIRDTWSFQPTGPAFEGHQYVDLDGSPGPGKISQSIATTIGSQYTLSFAYANNYDGGNTSIISGIAALVDVLGSGGNLISPGIATLTHTNSVSGNFNWTQFSTVFTADATTTTLQFTSKTTRSGNPFSDNYGILLDNVSVMASTNGTVPEASSAAIWLLLGLTIFGGQAKLCRRDVA